MSLSPLKITRLTPEEKIILPNASLTMADFWAWSASDLVSNVTRGVFAEFLVAQALGIDVKGGVRDEWDPVDLRTPDGVTVQVKSAAYIQTWGQREHSKIVWDCAPRIGWDAATNTSEKEAKRHSQVYVFALFAAKEKEKITNATPLDVSHWRFFVMSAKELKTRRSVTLQHVEAHAMPFEHLADAVRKAAASH